MNFLTNLQIRLVGDDVDDMMMVQESVENDIHDVYVYYCHYVDDNGD